MSGDPSATRSTDGVENEPLDSPHGGTTEVETDFGSVDNIGKLDPVEQIASESKDDDDLLVGVGWDDELGISISHGVSDDPEELLILNAEEEDLVATEPARQNGSSEDSASDLPATSDPEMHNRESADSACEVRAHEDAHLGGATMASAIVASEGVAPDITGSSKRVGRKSFEPPGKSPGIVSHGGGTTGVCYFGCPQCHRKALVTHDHR